MSDDGEFVMQEHDNEAIRLGLLRFACNDKYAVG